MRRPRYPKLGASNFNTAHLISFIILWFRMGVQEKGVCVWAYEIKWNKAKLSLNGCAKTHSGGSLELQLTIWAQ